MSGHNKFQLQKNQKSIFYMNQKINHLNGIDVNNILVSKKEPYGRKNLFNTLLDTMIMILLDIMHKNSTNEWICQQI